MASVRIKNWRGGEAVKEARREAAKRMNKAAGFLRSRIVVNLSDPTRSDGPSLPGDYPHSDTGRLRNSIVAERATEGSLSSRVGTNVEYAKFLEEGTTSKMAMRSFLLRTFREQKGRLRRIVEGKA